MSLKRSAEILCMSVIKKLIIIGLLFNSINVFSQDANVDTPNLSLENGNFEGWELYEGRYSYENGSYEYGNWVQSPNTEKIEIVNGNSRSQDPVIACWNLPTNPEGITSVRIGSYRHSESYSQGNSWAAAEKLVYKFVVAENSTLLTCRFASVLHCSDLDNKTYSNDLLPAFTVNVDVVNPATGGHSNLSCGETIVKGDSRDASVTVLGNNSTCSSSIEGDNVKKFVYCPWTYGNFDLSNHIGEEVTITILNRDGLAPGVGTSVEASEYRAYGYFWAETKKLGLRVKNCGSGDAEIIAPDGFVKYEWMRDGTPIAVDQAHPQRLVVKQNDIRNGVKYKCTLSSSNNACSKITLETELQEVGVNIDFDYNNDCGGTVRFTDKTQTQGDVINSHSWNFGDGNISTSPNPKFRFRSSGDHAVTVTVRTEMGCSQTVTKTVNVRDFPDFSISPIDSVCYGESFTLSAINTSANTKYLWNTGETTQSIQVDSLKFSQQFSVEVEDEFACHYKDSLWVNVKPVALFDVVGDEEVCLHDSVTLTARAYSITSKEDMVFLWSTGETTPQIKVCPTSDGEVYTVDGTYKNGCLTRRSKTIKVNPVPVVTVTGTDEICQGNEATITAEATQSVGTITYVWEDLHGGAQRTEYPETTTTYTVRAIDEKRCGSSPMSHTVRVKPIPVIKLTGDSILCEEMSTKLTVLGASDASIRWYDGTTGVNSITRKPTQDTTYWVEGEADGCRARAEISVRLWSTPSIWVGGNTSLCPGDVTVLKAHGAHHYKWDNGKTSDSIVVSPTSDITYKVYGYSDKNCETSTTVPVTVSPLPKVKTKGEHDACKGSVVRIEAYDEDNNALFCSWDNGLVGQIINPQVNADSKFTVTMMNKYGCVSSAVHQISVTTPPDISYTGETIVCLGDSVTLQAYGASQYTWDDGVTQATGSTLKFMPNLNKRIRLTGSNVSSCPTIVDIQIGVITPPTLYISGDSAVCLGDPFTLFVSGASSYRWSTGDVSSSITYNLEESGEYTVYGTDGGGCTSKATKYVNVRPNPVVTITKGAQTGCQNKADTINLYASGAITYQWTCEPANESVARNGYTDHLVAYLTDTTHFMVEGTNEFGCKGYAEYDVDLLPRQEMSFTVYPTFIETGNSNVRFSGVSPKASKWYWEADDGDEIFEGENISHLFDPNAADSFVVRVKAVDQYGCEFTGRQSIYTWIDFWAPEGFTPNGDDLNDSFKFYGGDFMDEFEYIIYNRLGEIIFEGKSINEEWDGTINGEPCPWGVYGWYCKYKSNYMGVYREGERKGFISLIR